MYYSGSDDTSNKYGVGVIVNTKSIGTSITFVPVSNRVMMLQILAKPRNLNIIQLYAPTTEGTDQIVEDFYKEVEQVLKVTKRHEINIVTGDMNAKIGEGEVQGVVGKYGLGERNDRGDRLVQFCQEHDLVVTNTFFQLPPRRLYTWTSPRHKTDHIMRNQIDFIMINNRFKNAIKSAKTYPGADIRSDHNPVVVELSCTLKKVKRKTGHKFDIKTLRHKSIEQEVKKEINAWAIENKLTPTLPSPSVEVSWRTLKTKLSQINQEFLLPKDHEFKQIWMTQKIYDLMEERRLYKHTDITKYTSLDKEIRREVRYARDSWYKRKCDHVEILHAKHYSFNLHKEIKMMTGKRQHVQNLLVDNNNLPILDVAEKKCLWEQYIESMFSDERQSLIRPIGHINGNSFLKEEVYKALCRAKTGKSAEPDESYIEVLKLVEEEHIDGLVNLFNQIYESGEIPQDWLKSIFITLPKKKNAKSCDEYRTISLMSQILKLFLSIIHERIKTKCDEQLSDSQFGFRAGVGTREALFAVQVLVQKCRDMQQDVFLCFVDYEKAFDRVHHDRLIEILNDIGLDERDIRFIQTLYWNQRATVRVDEQESEEIAIKRGVRQGCILSPTLFNLYSETIMAEALETLDCGVKVNGRLINNLRYADDTVLIASTETELQRIVNRVNECSLKAGLTMNTKKTKFMIISNTINIQPDITISGLSLERVNKYKYLGTWLIEEWESDVEIKTRIEIARSAFGNMQKVLCNRNIKIALRVRLLQCYIWPILLYGCEAWTIKEHLRKRIEAFEMWAYRRMLAISWTQKVTNEEVLRRIGYNRKLLKTIKQRKVAYLGHVLRHDRYEILQLIMMGKVAGKRKVGRRKKSWLRNIREWTGIASAAELFRLAKDKKKYAELTANLH